MKTKPKQKQLHTGKKNTPRLAPAESHLHWKYFIALAIILLISFIIYLPVLHNGLLGWDDNSYIKNNPLVHSINLGNVFSKYVMGNYHPLTILAFALQYHFFGLNETGYHAVNLLLHLLNIILVFYAVYLLSDKAEVGLVAALLFGIHPMHVESVAWAAELKDLLYTLFFLVSYIFYLKYLKEPRNKYYIFALVLFLFSLLSKAMAASLPVVLLLTDYFRGRKFNMKVILEKVPFFVLAIIFGIIAVIAQKSSGAISDTLVYTFPQRLIFASYGFITYLDKLIVPLHLSAFYPYPMRIGEAMPAFYYFYVLFLLGLVACVIYSLRFSRKIFFGLGLFAVTVFLVLQLLPVGGVIMADRYSYIPSIGIFYLAGEGIYYLWNKKQKLVTVVLLLGFTVFFSVKTNARCEVWKTEMNLWNDVISQDQTVPYAYYGRGVLYMNEKKNKEALDDFNKAIALNPKYADAYTNRANLYMNEKKNEEALNDFTQVIALNPDYPEAYYNRGTLLMNSNRNEKAMGDFNKAVALRPDFVEAYYNRGVLYMIQKNHEECLNDFSKVISLRPNFAEAYYYRALAEYYSGKDDAACMDMKQAVSLGYKPAEGSLSQVCK